VASQTETQTRLARPEAGSAVIRIQRLVAAGGLLGALAASSCCIVPLVLFGLGVSGARIGNLTRLAPYQPYFLAATSICLGYGYWLVYRSGK
jgi:mercuric ion transport protein